MLLKPFFLSKVGAAFLSGSLCSPSKCFLDRLNTHSVMSPDSHKCCFRRPEAVGLFSFVPSDVGQRHIQWRQYKAQFLKQEDPQVWANSSESVFLH